jgi:hypothetical protein
MRQPLIGPLSRMSSPLRTIFDDPCEAGGGGANAVAGTVNAAAATTAAKMVRRALRKLVMAIGGLSRSGISDITRKMTLHPA